ncbi:LysR family transcriptional regulator [Pleomorphomonas oryzae]|uniref:LysR family transcriptional regulator n=1 Tax=Pleomorphomonas oryzae TaxID=261934 RepID=UPI0004076241|nr:LysR family transcriptional regulator [Pleomorphomonas oryzae]
MDKIGAMTAFVLAADARSFTAAGRQIGLSSSAVGKAIGRLEERLGVSLFHRSTRTVTLTEEGAMFLERCRRIQAEIEAAELELAETRGSPNGTLRVSLPIINAFMVPMLNGFMQAYPDVQLDLDFRDDLVDIIEEGFDAVIRAGNVSDSRLMSRVLGEFRLKLVASPDYLARAGTPRLPEDLAHHACLLHRFATSRKFERWPLTRNGDDLDVALRPAAVANTIEPLLLMAEQGLGIACLPDVLLEEQLASGRLRKVLDDHLAHVGIMRLLWPASRYLSPRLRVFIDFVSKQLFASGKGSLPI